MHPFALYVMYDFVIVVLSVLNEIQLMWDDTMTNEKIKIKEILYHEQRIRWIETEIYAQYIDVCVFRSLFRDSFSLIHFFFCECVFSCALKWTSEVQIVEYERITQNERTSSEQKYWTSMIFFLQ